jgi:uncharacterized membrane protein YkgB
VIDFLIRTVTRLGLLTEDLDYYLIRGALVFIFFIFGYQKWFEYEAHVVLPFITHGPFTFWLYPAFGVRGASAFLGASEWTFGTLLLLGFWSPRLGFLGAAGSTLTFIATVTIIPFFPNAWAARAGGFPAMTVPLAFLMKDIVLLAASIYLLKQDAARSLAAGAKGVRSAHLPAGHRS